MIRGYLMGNVEILKIRYRDFLKGIFKARAGDCGESPAVRKVQADCVEEPVQEYDPKAGQPGRNVQWVPASQVVINRMFDLAKVTPEDYVIDPGSGDGRMVISAARLGARALGIEFNPRLVELSRKNAEKEGVENRAIFVQGDLFTADLSEATVLALFLREDINIALRPKILDMKPGTRIVSNIFHMRDWKADEVIEVEDENYYFKNHTVYFWVVPAKAGGAWKMPHGELTLEQNFQMIKGAIKSGGATAPVSGKMTGERINFTAGGRQYTGRVAGDMMELETDDGIGGGWKATLTREGYQPDISSSVR